MTEREPHSVRHNASHGTWQGWLWSAQQQDSGGSWLASHVVLLRFFETSNQRTKCQYL